MKRLFLLLVIALVATGIAFAEGLKKKRPLPAEYGRVVLNNYSEKAGIAPVVFNHWLHRAKFTCRLCHVDIGFAMKAGVTGIRASDNEKGYYCGKCHNDNMVVDGRRVFESCSTRFVQTDKKSCKRCHSLGQEVKFEYEFSTFTEKFPKARLGNGIDWEKAEVEGDIRPIDFIERVSAKRNPISAQRDFALEPNVRGLPDIIFSHKKHTVWGGCELCHPEIFIGVKKGITKYSMSDIFEGKYCGACHGTVAFPLVDCQRCHTRPVQR